MATRFHRATRPRTSSSSTPAASSTAPSTSRSRRLARRCTPTARSSSPAVSAQIPQRILDEHPKVLAVTGPHATEQVLEAVHQHLPRPHDPFNDLVPAQGIRLTPRHYAYLKISEGCNNKCSFCIIPSLRGRLASRPLGRCHARGRAPGGRRRQGTAGDLAGHQRLWRRPAVSSRPRCDGQQYETRFVDLARALGTLGVWVRMHYVYPYPHVDDVLPLMADGRVLPYLDIPFQHGSPSVLKRMKRPAHCREHAASGSTPGAARCPTSRCAAASSSAFPARPTRSSRSCWHWMEEAQLDRVGCFKYSPVDGATANDLPDPVARRGDGRALRTVHGTRCRHFRSAPGGKGGPRVAGAGRSRRWQRRHRAHRRAMRRRSMAWSTSRRRVACAPANSPPCGSPTAGTYDLRRRSCLRRQASLDVRGRPATLMPNTSRSVVMTCGGRQAGSAAHSPASSYQVEFGIAQRVTPLRCRQGRDQPCDEIAMPGSFDKLEAHRLEVHRQLRLEVEAIHGSPLCRGCDVSSRRS